MAEIAAFCKAFIGAKVELNTLFCCTRSNKKRKSRRFSVAKTAEYRRDGEKLKRNQDNELPKTQ